MGAPLLQVQTVADLQALLDAERSGSAFLRFRDGEGRQQILRLDDALDEIVFGRQADPGIQLDWDPQVSRVHALMQRVGGAWTIVDDGLSRNGTFVNKSASSDVAGSSTATPYGAGAS